jgi:hypothetical protein
MRIAGTPATISAIDPPTQTHAASRWMMTTTSMARP